MELKHEVWPLDLAILPLLPDEGSMLGKYHHLGRRVRDVVAELDDEFVTSAKAQTRMRVMKENGLIVDKPTTGGRIWQRTEKGKALMRERGVAFNGDGEPHLRSVGGDG